MNTTAQTPTAAEMIEQGRAKYPGTRFAVSKSGGSIAHWSDGRWVACSMLLMGFGWVSCSSNIVQQSDWIESK